MAHQDGNPVLVTAMADRDATVRAAAVNAWRDIRGQVERRAGRRAARRRDADGARRGGDGGRRHGRRRRRRRRSRRSSLSDADPIVRRNAAWALGKLGSGLVAQRADPASSDASGLVRMVARAALATLN